MSVIFILIIAGFIVSSGFLVAFVWAIKNGQYDDRHTPAMRILFEDFNEKTKEVNKTEKS